MMSPVGFAVCHEYGKCSIFSKREFLVVSVSFSVAEALNTPERYLKIPIATAKPMMSTATDQIFAFIYPIPKVVLAIQPATEAGSIGSLPIIESQRSLIIWGYTSSSAEVMSVQSILKTNRYIDPFINFNMRDNLVFVFIYTSCVSAIVRWGTLTKSVRPYVCDLSEWREDKRSHTVGELVLDTEKHSFFQV